MWAKPDGTKKLEVRKNSLLYHEKLLCETIVQSVETLKKIPLWEGGGQKWEYFQTFEARTLKSWHILAWFVGLSL